MVFFRISLGSNNPPQPLYVALKGWHQIHSQIFSSDLLRNGSVQLLCRLLYVLPRQDVLLYLRELLALLRERTVREHELTFRLRNTDVSLCLAQDFRKVQTLPWL